MILGFVVRIACCFNDPVTFKTLYVAFVVSGLEYVSIIWSPY